MDGVIVEKATFESFLPNRAPSKTAENQGLTKDDEVVVRSISLRNIYEVTVGGIHYVRTDLTDPIINKIH